MSNWETKGIAGALTGVETVPLNQVGVSKYATINMIKAFIASAFEATGAVAAGISAHLGFFNHVDITHGNRVALDLVTGTNTGDQDLSSYLQPGAMTMGIGSETEPLSQDTAFGEDALLSNTIGYNNTAVGHHTLRLNTTGHDNTAIGANAGKSGSVGNYNTAVGAEAMSVTGSASRCVALGYKALPIIATGVDNVALGYYGLKAVLATNNNVAIGSYSLEKTIGNSNTAIGHSAGNSITLNGSNTFIGAYAGDNTLQKIDVVGSTAIGVSSYTTKDNQVSIGNVNTSETILRGAVFIPALCLSITTCTASVYSMVGEASIIVNYVAGTFTLVLPIPSQFPGRVFMVKTLQNQLTISGSANVIPLAGGTPGTAILPATAGKFAMLQSDGTNWQIMMSN